MKPLTDTDLMPFGKFKDKLMQDVPADYLHWLWISGKKHDNYCPVACYIRENLDGLKMDYEDGIWS